MKNNEVENAICYIRDYIQRYNERSASAVARKLMDAVNVVIENYNKEEQEIADLENADLMKDLFAGLAFGGYIRMVDVEDALRVPMIYYVKRIQDNYLSVEDVHKRFYYAYGDHRALVRNTKYLKDEMEYLEDLRRIYNEQTNDDKKEIARRAIESSEIYIENLRESIRKFE